MRATYFPDTDTLLIQFSDHPVADTYDLNENVLVETDEHGRLVSLTIEHAKTHTDVEQFSYHRASA